MIKKKMSNNSSALSAALRLRERSSFKKVFYEKIRKEY